MEIKTIAKRWGSSIGIVLPKAVVDLRKIQENDEILIEIKTRPLKEQMFGKYPRTSKRTAQEIKDEARRGWD